MADIHKTDRTDTEAQLDGSALGTVGGRSGEPNGVGVKGAGGAQDQGSCLLPHHADMLKASAISDDVMQERGYRSVKTHAELKRLGFGANQLNTPALLIPVYGVDGQIATYQHRPDEPRVKDGKALKYETPSGSRVVLDVPPPVRPRVASPSTPLFITEGVKKADAAASHGLCCIALLGVWNWRGRNPHDGMTALGDWDSIALKDADGAGRSVYLVFDSDVAQKPPVAKAMRRLQAFLRSRGADVWIVYLPPRPDGSKQGLDDFFAAGGTVLELLSFATDEVREAESERGQAGGPYREDEGGLVWMRQTRDGLVPTRLTNFTARIVADVLQDDGAEPRRQFEIEACLHGLERRFTVSLDRFATMAWPIEQLGAQAVVSPGMGLKDHARAAIQMLSEQIETRTVYTHTGWRLIDDRWLYLHAGGAIGAAGEIPGMEVALPQPLARYGLASPPRSEDRVAAVRADIRVLGVAPDAITIPLLAAAYRAAIGGADFSVHVVGPTGTGKSELAALVQQHFGPGMDARHLPGSWSSTANASEGAAFAAKDVIYVIDDFCPVGSPNDIQRYHREADRIFRGQGNSSARQRMRADGSLRPARPPRGLILSTGEDVPNGQSLRARLLVVEVEPGTLDWDRLSACQRDAALGQYARAMAAFVQWLARDYGAIQAGLRDELVDLRALAAAAQAHRRTPEIVANLALGWRYFLRFAREAGAITEAEAEALWSRGWRAIGTVARRQAEHHLASEPTARFIELLASAISSGVAHVAAPRGGRPPRDPEAWGWRPNDAGVLGTPNSEWRGLGKRIGWVDDEGLYLDVASAYGAAQQVGQAAGEPLTIGAKTLSKRLHEKGLLAKVDAARDKLTVRRVLEGARRNVLHLSSDVLNAPEVAASTPPTAEGDPPATPGWKTVVAGPVPGADSVSGANQSAHRNELVGGADQEGADWDGPVGPVGPIAEQDSAGELLEFVTLDEFLAQDDGDDPPEPDTPPTWDELVGLEPRLAELLDQARAYGRVRRERFCANHVYVWEVKPQLVALVGWDRDAGPDLLRAEAAYDVARETVYDALPGCGDCLCIPHGGIW